jgi:hypothetical protein
VNAYDVQGKARALCFSPDGKHIAVGMHSGQLIVLTEDATAVVATVKVRAGMHALHTSTMLTEVNTHTMVML